MPGLVVVAVVCSPARTSGRPRRPPRRASRGGGRRSSPVLVAGCSARHILPMSIGRSRRVFARTRRRALSGGADVAHLPRPGACTSRRFSPDSLIGWTRLISGRWRDPDVGRDILIGISAGLAMTVLYAAHNLDSAAVRPARADANVARSTMLMGTRYVLVEHDRRASASAIINSMLAVVGIVALLILLKRAWLAWIGRDRDLSCGSSFRACSPPARRCSIWHRLRHHRDLHRRHPAMGTAGDDRRPLHTLHAAPRAADDRSRQLAGDRRDSPSLLRRRFASLGAARGVARSGTRIPQSNQSLNREFVNRIVIRMVESIQ